MGRAFLDRLVTELSDRLRGRLRPARGSAIDRLGTGLRRPAGPAPAASSPSPTASGFRLFRLARAWRTGACALAAAFILLLGVETAPAHDEGGTGHVHLVDFGFGAHNAPDAPTGYAEPGPGAGEITLYWTPATTGEAAVQWSRLIQKSRSGQFQGPFDWRCHHAQLHDFQSGAGRRVRRTCFEQSGRPRAR